MRTRPIWLIAAAVLAVSAPAAGAASSTGTSGSLSTLPGLSTGATATTPASSSGGQSGPLTVPNPTPTSTTSGGISTAESMALGLVVLLVLAGIGRFIVVDARARSARRAVREIDRGRGSVRPIEHRVKRGRAKEKRARAARRARR
jgi:hypothetical protein